MSSKERLDILLVNRGLFESREKAKAAIMAGQIFMDTTRIDKAGTKIPVDANIVVKGNTLPYVSRGGLKLEKAIQTEVKYLSTQLAPYKRPIKIIVRKENLPRTTTRKLKRKEIKELITQ